MLSVPRADIYFRIESDSFAFLRLRIIECEIVQIFLDTHCICRWERIAFEYITAHIGIRCAVAIYREGGSRLVGGVDEIVLDNLVVAVSSGFVRDIAPFIWSRILRVHTRIHIEASYRTGNQRC